MSLKKKVSKSIALTLVGSTFMIPMLSSVSAMENQYPNVDSINNGVIKESKSISDEEFEKKVKELDIHTTKESKNIILQKLEKIKQEGFEYESNKDLSAEEIEKRYTEINEKYDLFEKVSEEDEEFLIAYQNIFEPINNQNQYEQNINARGLNQNKPIKTVQKASMGVTARVSGSLRQKGGSAWNFKNSYGGSVYFNIVGGASKVRKVTGQIKHEAWGIIGEGGVAKVYDGQIEYVKTKAPFAQSYVDRDQPYTAYTSLMKTYAYMIIDHSGGQFNVSAGV